MLDGDGAGSPGDGGSGKGAQGNVGFFFGLCEEPWAHSFYRNSGKAAQVKKRPSTRRKLSDYVTPQKGSGDAAVPYDVEIPPPVPTPPPPPRAGGNEHLTHEVMQAICGGTTNELPSRSPPNAGSAFPIPLLHLSKIDRLIDSDPLAVGSTAGAVAEREPLRKGGDTKGFKEDVGGFKGKDTGGLNGKPEVCCDPPLLRNNAVLTPSEKERGRGDVGRENKGKGTEHAVKKGKGEDPLKPAENTTTAPARTKVTHNPAPATREAPSDTRNNNAAGSSGSLDNLNKPPTALSPGSGPDEDTASSTFPRSFARCQEINQTNCNSSSPS